MSFKRLRKQAGFTLIELLIVIVILGTLASIALPNLTGLIEEARVEAITFNSRTLLTEMKVYEFENDQYPAAANVQEFISNYRDQLNALDSIVQEVGTDDYSKYNYMTNGNNSDYVFSVQLPNNKYVVISAKEGLEEISGNLSNEDLEDYLTLNE
ncbi:general secretion pathway protein G [Halanaerobium saccharolyticum]|uniref:General secretion pathway protein G n=1 Tax=Halanaerobium saccharolyticum TaxID=43595 RepID=A0A4R6LVX6_9FIRM|nr:type II secretion system protein [Halanaerobium saccharolyticum]TDO92245.1 general secretion pathway protein G [Halanaerobium saccharolyticum]